jgi:hypothetical protein
MQVLAPSRHAAFALPQLIAVALLGALPFAIDPVTARAQKPPLSEAESKATAQALAEPIKMTLESPLGRTTEDFRGSSGQGEEISESPPLEVVSRFGRWFPIAVTLTNTNAEATDAKVTLSLRLFSAGDPAGVGSVSSFETRVDLPKGARKRVWLYGRRERGATDAGEVVLSTSGSRQEKPFRLREPSEGARVVWTVSDSDERLVFLRALPRLRRQVDSTIPPVGLGSTGAVETLGSSHEMVPTRWIGLEAVDLVVLHDFPHTSLSTEQVDALKGYVAAGGTLQVLGGSNFQRLAASPLRELWPVAPTGSRVISRRDREPLSDLVAQALKLATTRKGKPYAAELPLHLSGPRELSGADRLGGAPLLAATGSLAPDARALSPSLDPSLAAQKRYGAGRVNWFAFDPTKPPFVGWRGQEELWRTAFANLPSPRRIAGVDARLETDNGNTPASYNYYGYNQQGETGLSVLRSALARSPQLRTPAASSIAWFLALYVFFLVPVNYVVLRALDRRELAWVTVPVIVLIFSTLSYAAAVRIKGTQLRARQVAIVQGSDASPLARADSMLWVFSPRKASYTIEGKVAGGQPDPAAFAAVYGDGRRSDALDNAVVEQSSEGDGARVVGAPINMWDYKSFVGHSVVPTRGGFAIEKQGGKRFLVNRSGQALRSATWIEDNMMRRLGDLAPNSRVNVDLAKPHGFTNSSIQLAEAAGKVFSFDNAGTGQGIASAALQVAGVNAGNQKAPMLVAWQPNASSALAIAGEAPVRETVSLWVWRFTE